MSTHHPDPSTGWEAQGWDATPGQESRAARVDPLRSRDLPEDPVVPGAVDTTVPIGTPDDAGQRRPEPHAPVDDQDARKGHPAPMMSAEPEKVRTRSDSGSGPDAWRDLQVQFVDDPTGAVEGAVRLVREALEASAGADGSADTEHLRQAFTRLRDVHARLTA